jgi:hypothetical protein
MSRISSPERDLGVEITTRNINPRPGKATGMAKGATGVRVTFTTQWVSTKLKKIND